MNLNSQNENLGEVITTSLSWIATANAIALAGFVPVFADINNDLNISSKSIEKLITPRTKAILVVHYAGRVCEMEKIIPLAQKYKIPIIEDTSQAVGARRNGILAGSFGEAAGFSLNLMKVLGAIGEAGVVLSDSQKIADLVEIFRYNGTINRESCVKIAQNGRLDTIQAAVLCLRVKSFWQIIEARRKIASAYNERLADISGILGLPLEKQNEYCSFYSYTILVENRPMLMDFLADCGIETKIQHPILMPHQPAYAAFRERADTKNAQIIVEQILSLPANEKTTLQEVDFVCSKIREFYGA